MRRRIGRSIGYPTANIRLQRLSTALSGIFAVRLHGIGEAALPGVASLGTRPTVKGSEKLLEVHLFEFDRDIYARHVSVEFVEKLRDEAQFASLDALAVQIAEDAREAREVLGV